MRERRVSRRYGLELPIALRRVPVLKEPNVLVGETGNISTGGIYFTTSQPLILGEVIDFSLSFSGLSRGADVRVSGRARVLRITQNSERSTRPTGIAVVTEEYHIEPGGAA